MNDTDAGEISIQRKHPKRRTQGHVQHALFLVASFDILLRKIERATGGIDRARFLQFRPDLAQDRFVHALSAHEKRAVRPKDAVDIFVTQQFECFITSYVLDVENIDLL